jgi:hypothetical protein
MGQAEIQIAVCARPAGKAVVGERRQTGSEAVCSLEVGRTARRLDNGSRVSCEVHARFYESREVRFLPATHLIVGFQHRSDGEHFLVELKERFQKFGLELHPDKTRLIEFGRFVAENRQQRKRGKPETFDFLGMTHICAKDRKGRFVVRRRTIRRRLQARLKEVRTEVRRRLNVPTRKVGEWLASVLPSSTRFSCCPADPSLMADSATEAYYQKLVQRSQQLLDSGVSSLKLVQIEWRPVVINGGTATAAAWETWGTSYAHGATEEARRGNLYTVVQSDGTWKIQSDEDLSSPGSDISRNWRTLGPIHT